MYHRIEFWPYLEDLKPNEIKIDTNKELIHLEKELRMFPDYIETVPRNLDDSIRIEVEETWKKGLIENPKLTNNLLPNIKHISHDGKTFHINSATYKTSFWIKNKLSKYSFETQKYIANSFLSLT